MGKSKKQIRLISPRAERRLTVAALAAILVTGGIAAAPLAAADVTINSAGDFKSALEGASSGDTITVGSSVGAVDLNGVSVKVTADNVTLQGASSFDLGAAIKTQAGNLLKNAGPGLSRNSLEGSLSNLGDSLLKNLPKTNVYNSAAATGTHAGISAPAGGFSLKNLTFNGTVANTDTSSGASKYMGLVGSTFDRFDAGTDPNDGQGLGLVENVAFVNNVVNSGPGIHNVGNTIFFTQRRYDSSNNYVSGADKIETLDGIKGSVFIGNKVMADMSAASSVGNRDVGGAGVGWAHLGKLDSSFFANNYVQGHHAFGGALFTYSIGSVADTIFYNNVITSDHDAYGGALYSSAIDSISGSIFIGNEAKGLDFGINRTAAAAGGAIQATGNAALTTGGKGINSIDKSFFAFNRAFNETGEESLGGAINVARNFKEVKNSTFYGNSVESSGDAFGGAIAVNVNEAGMTTTITNSLFLNNSVTSEGEGGGGAISIGTTTAAAGTYTLNLMATNGGLTEFSGNSVNGEANSIFVGKQATANANQTDVTFNVIAQAGGTVALLDPLKVAIDNGKTFTLVNHSQGKFIWDGINDFSADGGSRLTLESGSNTYFKEGFHLHSTNGDAITVDLENGANLTMILSGRNKNMALFEDATVINDTGAKLSGVYYGFTDQTGSWLLADHDSAAQASNLSTTDTVDSATGSKTSVTVSTKGTETWVNMVYHGPTKAYAAATPNAFKGRYALQQAWTDLIVPTFTSDAEQAAYYGYILRDLSNFTAEAYASQGTVALSTSYGISRQVLDSNSRSWFSTHGPSAPSSGDYDGRLRMWVDYIGSRIDQDKHDGYSGYDVHNNGAVLGMSYDVGRTWTLGGYMSVSDGETNYDNINSDIDTDIYQGGLFATYKAETNGFGASLDVSYALMENDSTRRFLGERYTASFDQKVFGVGLGLSYEFNPWENGSLTPFLDMRYQHLKQDSFRETGHGGLMPLNVKSTDGDSFTSVLGLSLEHNFYLEDTVFTPRLNAGWRHEFGDRDISASYSVNRAALVAKADSVEKAANAFDVGASFTLVPLRCGNTDFGINGGYSASISSDRLEHNFYGGLEIKF